MDKDCRLTFSDGRPDYPFSSSTPLCLVLQTAKDRNWPLLAIHTPNYVLSVFTPEEYETAVSEKTFTQTGV